MPGIFIGGEGEESCVDRMMALCARSFPIRLRAGSLLRVKSGIPHHGADSRLKLTRDRLRPLVSKSAGVV